MIKSTVLQILKGYSGSDIELIQNEYGHIMVRKSGNISRNIERLYSLKNIGIQIPSIIEINNDEMFMEYIEHQDMKNWLIMNNPLELAKEIEEFIKKLSLNSINKDYTLTYYDKLSTIKTDNLPFTVDEFVKKLPQILPQSEYHGDLNLDNILYNRDRGFVYIDPITTVYDSWIFDLAKLRQDLQCRWFIRYTNELLDTKLAIIQEYLADKFEFVNDPYLLILMLLRILPYAQNKEDENWLLKNIHSLWK